MRFNKYIIYNIQYTVDHYLKQLTENKSNK